MPLNHAGDESVQPSGQEPAEGRTAAQSGVAVVFVAVPAHAAVARLASVPHTHSCSQLVPPHDAGPAEPAYSVTFSLFVCSTSFSTLSGPASTSAAGGNGKLPRWSSCDLHVWISISTRSNARSSDQTLLRGQGCQLGLRTVVGRVVLPSFLGLARRQHADEGCVNRFLHRLALAARLEEDRLRRDGRGGERQELALRVQRHALDHRADDLAALHLRDQVGGVLSDVGLGVGRERVPRQVPVGPAEEAPACGAHRVSVRDGAGSTRSSKLREASSESCLHSALRIVLLAVGGLARLVGVFPALLADMGGQAFQGVQRRLRRGERRCEQRQRSAKDGHRHVQHHRPTLAPSRRLTALTPLARVGPRLWKLLAGVVTGNASAVPRSLKPSQQSQRGRDTAARRGVEG